MTETAAVKEVLIGVGGDPFIGSVIADMTESERDYHLRLYHAPSYRQQLAKLRDWGVPGPDEEHED